MAAGNLGSLVVALGLDGVQFFAGLSKAEYEARKSMAAIASAAGTLQNTFRNLGVGLSVAGIEQFVAGAIKAQAELGRLAERAGTTVEELSSMRVAAHEGGVGMDEIALAATRLSKAVFEGQDKSTKAALALELLGLKAKDLAKLPTAQALQTVAGALDKFKESTGKTAVEMEILGKSGPKMGAFLKAIAENGTVAASVTTEMANAARDAEAKFFTLTDALGDLRTHGVNALLPALNDIVKGFTELQKTNDGTLGFWTAFGESLRVASLGMVTLWSVVKSATTSLITLGAVLNLDVFSGHFAADVTKLFAESDKKINDNIASLLKFYDAIAKGSPALASLAGIELPAPKSILDRSAQYKGDPYYGQGGGKKSIGNLPVTATGALDDPSRKILEAALAALKANTEQERAVMENRDRFLQAVYDRGESSITEYYAQKQAAQDEDLSRTSDNYRQEIALIQRFIDTAKTERDKAQGEKEKVAATSRQQLAIIQAAGKAQQILDEQDRSLKEYGRTLDEINAAMLELQGNTAAAAAIRFDAQKEGIRATLTATIQNPASTDAAVAAAKAARDQLDTIGKLTVAQARLNDVTGRYSSILSVVGVAQARIDLLAQTGSITEIDAINLKSELAQKFVGILSQQADAYEKEANKFAEGTKQRADALLQVAQFRLQIDQLAAASDVLGKKFSDIFSGATSNFITDLIDHTKTWKQTWTDAIKSVEQSISKIAAQNISESLFGKEGALGGVGGFFAKLFGGKGADAGAQSGVAALGSTATTAAGSAAALAVSMDAAASAATMFSISASAGGIGGSFFGSGAGGLDSILGPGGLFGFARGGEPPVGKWSIVGENGPELFMPKTSGTVIPMDDYRKAGKTVSIGAIHVNVPQGTSGASASQIGLRVARELQHASGSLG